MLAILLLPVAAGLAGAVLPAFGWLPALGGHGLSLDPWRRLFAQPGIAASVRITLTTGFGATVLSLVSVVLFCAACHDRRLFRRAQAAIAPALASPQTALALGFVALAAPSGWLARLAAPWAGNPARPPDITTVNDADGLSLLLTLAMKEAPYLLLATLAALNQVPAARLLAAARALGQPAPLAWLKVVLPAIYRQLRLPVAAVLAYALSAVDVAAIVGPALPPPLASLAVRWSVDPDLGLAFPAAAASCLLLGLTAALLAAWWGLERVAEAALAAWAASGRRGGAVLARAGGAMFAVLLASGLLSLAAAALWSVAGPWRFPNAWPTRLDGGAWARQAPDLVGLAGSTLSLAVPATAVSLVLACAALDAVSRHGRAARPGLLAFAAVPLLIPQTAFLFGLQVALLQVGLRGGWVAALWAHVVFVLPYALLSLAGPWAALDPRLARVAACLGASPRRVLWRVTLPVLLRPLLAAAAIGVGVSVAQYLATLFAGGGRVATLTTEAVTLASGGDRRILGVFAVAQAAIPLAAYGLAFSVPRVVWRQRAALR